MTKIVARLRDWDARLDRELPLLILLVVLVVLRLPNFLEPVWYGDEAIYLTIGNALRQGATLYADIVDHKTPVIYFLSMVPNQLAFRMLLLGWMAVATTAFYHLSLKLFERLSSVFLATLAFVVLTSIPVFEGNIPNGELFMMGFVLVAALLLSYTKLYTTFFTGSNRLAKGDVTLAGLKMSSVNGKTAGGAGNRSFQQALGNVLNDTNDVALYLAAGGLLGLAILTKVPAVFDAVALLSVGWFSVTNAAPGRWPWSKQQTKKWRQHLRQVVARVSLVGVGVVLTILLSVGYFTWLGAGPDYLEFGLLFNFRYAQALGMPFNNALLTWLFSLGGKLTVSLAVIAALTLWRGRVRPAFQFAATWLVLALFASLLTNRPYPHYFQQTVPGLALSGALIIGSLSHHFSKPVAKTRSKESRYLVTETGIGLILVLVFWQVIQLLQVSFYPTLSYYQRSLNFVSGRLSTTAFFNSFDGLMVDNYRAAAIITQTDDPYLFIWGTNAPLYALTGKVPVGRFTVSFHVKDFDAFDETFQVVQQQRPTFIVVMNNERDALPGLDQLLASDYIPNYQFDHFTLWKKQPAS